MKLYIILFLSIASVVIQSSLAKTTSKAATYQSDSDDKERWNYVNVRPGAHMFWWLYMTQATDQQTAPLIIWLQGGPGGSSAGFGNFGELGPLDEKLKPRPTTWLSVAHLLFIDNPVGAGYSYAETDDAFTTNVDQIAADLLAVVSSFIKESPEFASSPLYIFSESYGGKMTAAFSKVLYQAMHAGKIKCNFKGLAMGDSWISPMDYVLTWGPYLYTTSLVDEEQLAAITKTAMACKAAFEAGNYTQATALWGATETQCNELTGGVNFYNILKWGQPEQKTEESVHRDPNTLYYGWPKEQKKTALDKLRDHHTKVMLGDALADLMNGPIRKKLGIIPDNVTWGAQSGQVFDKQSGDFMKPVISVVDDLLKETELEVVVYTGQLDLICDTLGTERWVQKLTWDGLTGYNNATRQVIKDGDGIVVAYHKAFKRFNFYWILDAGHMVPADQGETALTMVKMVINKDV